MAGSVTVVTSGGNIDLITRNGLGDGLIFVGNANNVATGVAMSGDATIDNTGAVTLTPGLVDKVRISLADTTTGFLNDKIIGGDGIITAITTPAGDEDLTITLGKHFLSLASTGLYTGAGLSIGATTGTFDIDAGEGLFIDSTTDFDNIEVQPVIISARTNIAITNILTDPVTFISVDKDDNIIQSSTFPDPTERRAAIFLGVVVHSDNVTVNTTNNLPVIANNPMAQMYDRWQAEGDFFNISGNILSANGANLNVNKSVGDVFKTSINYDSDKTNPHTKTFALDNAFTFRYRLRDSTEDADTTVVDPNNYDAAGVKTTVPTRKYTIQRFTIFPSAIIRVQYGQNLYDSLEDAEANAALEPFVIEPNIDANGLLRLHLIVEQGATDLSDILSVKFIEAARSGVAKETNVGGAIFRTQLLNDASTGLRDGGLLTANGGDNTKFDVASGNGRVIDNTTDSNNPVLKEVRWDAFIAEDLPNIATQIITFIAIDENDNLIKQNADFTAQEHREMVVLGRIGHIDKATVTSVTNLAIPFVDPLLTTVDFAAAVGNINTNGNVFTPNGANLLLNKSVGAQFRLGSNKHLDDKNPHVTATPLLTGLTFIPAFRDGSGGVSILTPTTTIDPNQFDDGSGTLQTVSNNKFTAPRVFHFSSNIVVVAFGQTVYDNLDDAVTGVSSDIFDVPGGVTGSINRAAIVVKQGTTDLTSSTNAKIITGSKFGEFTGGGGGGGSAGTLQAVYDGSTPNPEILTNATNGAFALRRGSALDTDTILEGQNNAGTVTFSIDGNGKVSIVSDLQLSEDLRFISGKSIRVGIINIINISSGSIAGNGVGHFRMISGGTAAVVSDVSYGFVADGNTGLLWNTFDETSLVNAGIVTIDMDSSNNVTVPNGIFFTNTYTVATLPPASVAAGLIFVSDETGGAIHAFSDGTNWRRMSDRAIVA